MKIQGRGLWYRVLAARAGKQHRTRQGQSLAGGSDVDGGRQGSREKQGRQAIKAASCTWLIMCCQKRGPVERGLHAHRYDWKKGTGRRQRCGPGCDGTKATPSGQGVGGSDTCGRMWRARLLGCSLQIGADGEKRSEREAGGERRDAPTCRNCRWEWCQYSCSGVELGWVVLRRWKAGRRRPSRACRG